MRGNLRIVPLLIAVLVSLAATTQAQMQPAESAKATYARIVAQIQAGQTDVDWKALRLASVQGGLSRDVDEHTAGAKMWAALNSKNYEEALKLANQLIAYNMANTEGHYGAMIAYGQTGRQAQSEAEKAKLAAIAQSIRGSNSGASAESAWFTVSVGEEYFLLHILGMAPKQQALTYVNGRAYDVMTVTDRSDPGHQYTYWFDTQTAMDALAKSMPGDKNESP